MTSRRIKIANWLEASWFGEQPYTLAEYYWREENIHIKNALAHFVDDWFEWRINYNKYQYAKRKMEGHGQQPEKPMPFFYLCGPVGLGKTEVLGRGIGRYMALNGQFWPAQYVHWPSYMNMSLSSGDENRGINWNADFLILDDLDRYKPQQSKASTWAMQKLLDPIKNRYMPTLIIPNRDIKQLAPYLAMDLHGNQNSDATNFVDTIIDSIRRKLYAGRTYKLHPHNTASTPERDKNFRAGGSTQNTKTDTWLFPIEKGWVNEVWY